MTWTAFQRGAGAQSLSRSEAAGCSRGLPTDSQGNQRPQDPWWLEKWSEEENETSKS